MNSENNTVSLQALLPETTEEFPAGVYVNTEALKLIENMPRIFSANRDGKGVDFVMTFRLHPWLAVATDEQDNKGLRTIAFLGHATKPELIAAVDAEAQ